MCDDIWALICYVYIAAALLFLLTGAVLTERRSSLLQRSRLQHPLVLAAADKPFRYDWAYQGLYENLIAHAEEEAKKLHA